MSPRQLINRDGNSYGIWCVKEDANYLIPILEEWVGMIERYVRYSTTEKRLIAYDAPWYWSEPCSVSLLGSAAWKSGCLVLAEMKTKKVSKTKNNEIKEGRADLYIIFPSTTRKKKERQVLIEAKQVWHSTTGFKKEKLGRELELACNDARRVRHVPANRRYGALFWVPRIKSKKLIPLEIKNVIEASKKAGADILAWCFPLEARRLKDRNGDGSSHYYPGVVLALKKPSNRRRRRARR